MAAVFALIFVPALFAVLCMANGVQTHLSFATVAAGTVFVVLITGMLGVLFKLSRQWEAEGDVAPHA